MKNQQRSSVQTSISRRRFGLAAGAAFGTCLLPSQNIAAQDTMTIQQNISVYRFSVGDIQATVISDGQISFPAWPTYAPDMEKSVVFSAMRQRYLTPPDYLLDANALLLEVGDKRLLIDTGWGTFAPQVGALIENLRAIGVEPDDIDIVILSHIHPDHVGD